MAEILSHVNNNLDQVLQTLDILEEVLPVPSMPNRWFKDAPKEKLMAIIDQAGRYQELCDILMTHPALILLKQEGEASVGS